MTISLRMMNIRDRDFLIPELELFVLFREPSRYGDEEDEFVFHNLSYEIHRQTGRARELSGCPPFFSLPNLITHHIDKDSPFYGKTMREIQEAQFELIVVYDGMEDLTSQNFRKVMSYLPHEILVGERFVPMVSFDREIGFEIDLDRLSDTLSTGEEYDENFVLGVLPSSEQTLTQSEHTSSTQSEQTPSLQSSSSSSCEHTESQTS